MAGTHKPSSRYPLIGFRTRTAAEPREGAAQKKVYALVGAAAAIAAAVGPLLGGFLTTYLSWRVGFALEVVIIAGVLSGIRLVHDVPYTGPRNIDVVGALLSVLVMGGIVLSILVRQEGGESVGILMAVGAIAMVGLVGGRVLRAHPHSSRRIVRRKPILARGQLPHLPRIE